MSTTTTRSRGRTAMLYLAFELGEGRWRLGFSTGFSRKPRHQTVAARDGAATLREIETAKERFGLPAEAQVACCYEAGRDGWLSPAPGARAKTAARARH